MTIRVVVVDDSALVRSVLSGIINAAGDMWVVGMAPDPHVAREMIRELNPDVITLDVEMPHMDGLDFLERLMRLRPMPVVMVSTLTARGAEVTLRALELGAGIIVKIDGDGQMDPAMLPRFVAPIVAGYADYTKGNRFYDLRHIGRMPRVRLFGNAVLSFMAKISTGYWDIFDPTNGYTAIDARVAALLPYERISQRYFFETDLLFRLGTYRAVVVDVPMDARYADEVSNLRIGSVLGEFLRKHLRNLCKRIFYNYFLRDLSIASLELLAGIAMLAFGVAYGGWHWWQALASGSATPIGTVMLAVLPVLVGLQLTLAFLAYDIAAVPRLPVSVRLGERVSAESD